MTEDVRAYITSAFEPVVWALDALGMESTLDYREGDGEHAARLSYHDDGRPLAAIVTIEDDVSGQQNAWLAAAVALVAALPDGLDKTIPALLDRWAQSLDVEIELVGGAHDGLIRPVAVACPWHPPEHCWVGPVAEYPVGVVISAEEKNLPDGVASYARDRVDRTTLRWRYVPAAAIPSNVTTRSEDA